MYINFEQEAQVSSYHLHSSNFLAIFFKISHNDSKYIIITYIIMVIFFFIFGSKMFFNQNNFIPQNYPSFTLNTSDGYRKHALKN